jgi:uncharacterized membrane protein
MYVAKASIKSDADASTIWDFVSDLKNFSKFLSNIREIKPLDDDIWEWRLQGILGIPLFCKTKVTILKSSNKVRWDSVEGPIATYGWLQVERLTSGSEITMSLNYQPKTGVLSDVFQRIFENPQQILEHDLHKLSTLLSPPTSYARTQQISQNPPKL